MFCNYCGKELADGAKFCNYCGAQTAAPQAQPAPQPAPQPVFEPLSQVPAQPEQTTPAQQPQEKKKGNWLVTAIVALAVFLLVRSCTSNALTGNSGSSYSSSSSQSTGIINLTKPSPTSTCHYGALYRNGSLTYGSARVRLSGYSLIDGQGGGKDLLISSDGNALFSVDKKNHINMSYDASTEQSMLSSISATGATDARMISFRKYEVDGYPVIRYIARCKINGTDSYIGELIICPEKEPNETLRLIMYANAEGSYSPIDKVFDTLSISSGYALSSSDTDTSGVNQITVK